MISTQVAYGDKWWYYYRRNRQIYNQKLNRLLALVSWYRFIGHFIKLTRNQSGYQSLEYVNVDEKRFNILWRKRKKRIWKYLGKKGKIIFGRKGSLSKLLTGIGAKIWFQLVAFGPAISNDRNHNYCIRQYC